MRVLLIVGVVAAWWMFGRKSSASAPGLPTLPGSPGPVIERGGASFYGQPYHGRTTASGEKFDMFAMTAAHKTLPFGTIVDVTDVDTLRTVRVRITDRGPFIAGRIIDLSQGAAERLGTIAKGVANVELRKAT